MKVCTDACIFGAYVAEQINKQLLPAGNILDIGTGTGLLSLMIAQKTNGTIDAVELDKAACKQANQNFGESPWHKQVSLYHIDALVFDPGKNYDCIICNPPFFEGDLKSGSKEKNAAKHDTTLTLDQLLLVTGRHLSPKGFFAVLLPFHRVDYFIELAFAANYFLNDQLLIKHTKTHPFFRGILFFSHHQTTVTRNELVIKNDAGSYTEEFTRLMEDYYLPHIPSYMHTRQ